MFYEQYVLGKLPQDCPSVINVFAKKHALFFKLSTRLLYLLLHALSVKCRQLFEFGQLSLTEMWQYPFYKSYNLLGFTHLNRPQIAIFSQQDNFQRFSKGKFSKASDLVSFLHTSTRVSRDLQMCLRFN